MNFNDMKIFVTIYETKSINKSSKILQYAQSNLSARLKVIETELGAKLFLRNYNGLVPTCFINFVRKLPIIWRI